MYIRWQFYSFNCLNVSVLGIISITISPEKAKIYCPIFFFRVPPILMDPVYQDNCHPYWASFVWLILKPRLHPSFPLHWIGTCNYNIELPFQTRKENTQNSFACKPCKRHDFIMCITNLKEVCLTYGVALVQFLTQWIRCGLRPKVWIDLEPNTMKHIIYS